MRLAEANRSPTGLLRFLLAATVLIPVVLFGAAAWLEYKAAFADAARELMRTSEVAREHAAKIFEGQSEFADRVTDLVRGMDTDTIIRSEKSLHEAFGRIVARLPQVESVLLVARSGRPLVSAGTYPVPTDVNLSDRDYFSAIVDGYKGTYVSNPQVGAVNKQLFFGLARPWLAADGTLNGVVDVAISPAAFQDFYQILVQEPGGDAPGKVITLIRSDGQLLARYPPIVGQPPKLPEGGVFWSAVTAQMQAGFYEGRSIVDPGSPLRLYAYRAVSGYPVYVTAGRNRDSIVAGWRRTMASHLVFGLPVAVALFAVTWTALARTRREQTALALTRREIERREQAEATLLRAQRLEAVGQITGGVAHDFNNLLTVILGSAEMLTLRADEPERVRYVADQIAVAAKRGGEITQQLLAFSGNQPLKPETIDLDSRLRTFKPLLDRAAREAIRVDLELAGNLYPVRLDPGFFEAAILNLVGNARDAMPNGGVITITTQNVDVEMSEHSTLGPGSYARVAVTDTGVGMDAATAAKAFEPFFTTKDVGKGTGLGLSQVYGFARQAGGEVRIATTPGRGTTVEILIPRSVAQASPDATAPDARPLPQSASVPVVLAVEDEPGVLAIAVDTLHELGYATITASTSAAALDRLRAGERIDLLFSDIVMPGGLNGIQLSHEARRLRPDLKILLTSGYAAGTDGNSEAFPLLTKPYDRTTLATSLRAVLADGDDARLATNRRS